MSFSARLKHARENKGITLAQLGQMIGKTEATVQRYESGNIKNLKNDVIELLSKYLDVTPAYLMGWDTQNNINQTGNDNTSITDVTGNVTITNNNTDTKDVEDAQAVALLTQKDILDVQTTSSSAVSEMLEIQKEILAYNKKIYNFLTKSSEDNTVNENLIEYRVHERLSAGVGKELSYEDFEYDTVYHDKDINHDIASWVYGDSMEPAYQDGEVALIKKTGFDYDGGVYAVVWDGQTYIKKVYREEDGLRLVSLNNKYRDKFAPFDEEPRVVGLVVGHFMPNNF